ncbi:MAG: glutathione S-transferase family protein [Pseudomonadota bacterium]
MYRLYGSPSTASLVVHWMLIELDVPFELEMLDFDARDQKAAGYLSLNPGGVVPTLIVDGKPMVESGAILMLLAERHPEAGLAPAVGSPERAQWLQWMVWLPATLMPAFRQWFYVEDRPGLADDVVRTHIESLWARIDAHLAGRRYMVGDRLSTVDMLVTMLMRWSRNMPRPATTWPNIAAYLQAMRANPALREAHARERLTDWIDG